MRWPSVFATSRPTVREALWRALRADGIINDPARLGVTTVARRPDPDVRRFAARSKTLSISVAAMSFRIVNEAGAAEQAALQKRCRRHIAAPLQHAWDQLEGIIETQGIGAERRLYVPPWPVARAARSNPFASSRFCMCVHDEEADACSSMNLSRNLSLVKTVAVLPGSGSCQGGAQAVLDAIRRKDAPQARRTHAERISENALERMFELPDLQPWSPSSAREGCGECRASGQGAIPRPADAASNRHCRGSEPAAGSKQPGSQAELSIAERTGRELRSQRPSVTAKQRPTVRVFGTHGDI
ncbi:hypothetical protein ACFFYR_35690 [Paraburkholderia dipogonis]|uniref:hypothetical protein n=1 Tax=Paraburkholderia dipogonis TaxID=1211383 RepID=UPI0035E73FAC